MITKEFLRYDNKKGRWVSDPNPGEYLSNLSFSDLEESSNSQEKAIRFTFSEENYLRKNEVWQALNMDPDYVFERRIGFTRVAFISLLDAYAIYKFHPAIKLSKRTSSLTLFPPKAWNDVEIAVRRYVGNRNFGV